MFLLTHGTPNDLTPKLIQEIIDLDRENMTPILEQVGRAFPDALRLKGLHSPTTELIVATHGTELAGYIEWCRDWNDVNNIYLVSIQIAPQYRGGTLFALLLRKACSELQQRNFAKLTSNVQTSNAKMIALFSKLGFNVTSNNTTGTLRIEGSSAKIMSNRIFLKGRTS